MLDLSTLGTLMTEVTVFHGAESKPFLAPRGVFCIHNSLIVSDTGQNRVFIWHQIPKDTYKDPDVIIGQTDIIAAGRNAGDTVSAKTLLYPSGLWSDGEKLIIADAWNHRVLIWLHFPTHHGQAADVVLGQSNFTTNHPNVTGQSAQPTAQSLHWPYGVYSNGNHLWIADTGNRRILFFDEIPTENFQPATKVIGQSDFSQRDYDPQNPIWPYAVKVHSNGAMAVSDTQFFRTLLWDHWTKSFDQPAQRIIGQANFSDSGQNQFHLSPNNQSLNWTYDACFYKKGLLVNDTGNSRILWFDQWPTQNNPAASNVIGRPNFTTSSDFAGNRLGTNTALYWPFSIHTHGQNIFIADTGNHRIIYGKLTL